MALAARAGRIVNPPARASPQYTVFFSREMIYRQGNFGIEFGGGLIVTCGGGQMNRLIGGPKHITIVDVTIVCKIDKIKNDSFLTC